MTEQAHFSYMPVDAFLDKRLTLEQLRVLGALFSFRGKDSNTVWPSRQAIAERCGLHLSNISTATSALERLGWLTKDGKGGHSKATRYTITAPDTLAHSATVAASATVAQQATRPLAESATRMPLADSATRKEVNQEHTKGRNHLLTEEATPIAAERKEPTGFAELWSAYPKREGDNPRKRALSAYAARLKAGTTPAELLDAVKRYATYCDKKGNTGTEFVKQAATFLAPDGGWRESWSITPSAQRKPTPDNFAARDYGHGGML